MKKHPILTGILLILLTILIMVLTSCQPKKPFVITEKDVRVEDGITLYHYAYISSNNVGRIFSETTDKYEIGDTIK